MKKLIVVGVVGGLVLAWIAGSRRPIRTPSMPAPTPAAAREPVASKPSQPPLVGTAMMAVKRFLKDPDSASFPPSKDWAAQPLGPGRWRVAGEVTALNSFNARVRQPVIVEMNEDGAQMRVTFIKIADKVAYGTPSQNGGRP